MKIKSPDFENNGKIPAKFTGDGQDINPTLLIENVPENTKILVLIMDDPDAPVGLWVHWLVWNISPETTEIRKDSIPENAIQGKNSWGKNNYGGPMPPSGTHRYFFKIYALSESINLQEGATKQEIEKAMEGKIIEKSELIGLYR